MRHILSHAAMEAETKSNLVTTALELHAVETYVVAFEDNSLAKTDSQSPENPNDKKLCKHSTQLKIHLTHDQLEVRTEDKTVIIDESNLASCFGKPFVYEQTPVGVAMGLAKTYIYGLSRIPPIDGLAWYVKATLVEEGEAIGCFNVMGQVGMETFKSGCIAYKIAQQILRKKQPNNTFFTNSKVYLHLPTSNGPSAGCTMVTSLLSLAMKKPVRKNLAMTGEITPTGRILRIGGVKEKTIAARRSQVKTVIFPDGNRRDIDELTENVKEGLDIHFADEYEQIFELAFNYDH